MSNASTPSGTTYGTAHPQFGRPSTRLVTASIRDCARQLGGARAFYDLGQYGTASDLAEDTERRLRELADRMELPDITTRPMLPPRTAARRWLRLAAACGAAATLIALIAVLATARPAHAATQPAPQRAARVVVDRQVERFTVTTRAPGQAAGVHAASLWIGYPGASTFTFAGSGTSTTSTVQVRAHLDATRLPRWGLLAAPPRSGPTWRACSTRPSWTTPPAPARPSSSTSAARPEPR